MKRIEFIAPVEAMRGNLSGAQKLQYPTDDQGAYEGPVGSVNYARNYSPRFVGSKRAKDGLKYFSVRTKTANHLTAKAKKAMALLGGAGAMYAAIVKNKSSQLYTSLYAQYLKFQELGDKRTFRAFMMDVLRRGLEQKLTVIVVAGPLSPISIDNPWNTTETTPNVQVAQEILVKFWTELALNGIVFTVDGMKGVARNGETFQVLIEDGIHNILNLTEQAVGDNAFVKLGSLWLTEDGDPADSTNEIMPIEYGLTNVAPVA